MYEAFYLFFSDIETFKSLFFRTPKLHRSLETPTRFSFNDGIISNICPSQGDNALSLNFKRGVLSALQNNLADFETKTQSVQEVCIIKVFFTYYALNTLKFYL